MVVPWRINYHNFRPHFPPRNAFNNDTVTVNAKIVIKELMDMNVKEETLRILAWIRMFWMDPRLIK